MLHKNRLYTPGPTQLLPSAQFAMAAATMHHRTADFRDLYVRTLADLKSFIGTQNDVILMACSGSGAMEASVSNLTSPGDKVLVLTAGKFGERWSSLAKAYGVKTEVVSAPYGETWTLDAVKEKLDGVSVVYMQGTETSTGVRHDVEGVAKLLKGTDTLLVVDAITGLGTTHFDVDGWGVDVIIGGSQKAVMIPPGLAFLSVSERAWKKMDATKNPRFYFDLRKERKSAAKGESAYTPATSLIAGLGAALDFIRGMGNGNLSDGRHALVENAETAAAMTRAAAEALGLTMFAKHSPAAAVSAINAPAGVDSGAIVKGFRNQFGAVVANGQGDEMKGKIFRVAHLGYYDYLDTIAIVGALEHVLASISKPAHVEFGPGLRAAQFVYAQRATFAAATV
ncbi:phosphoserine aminotransferase apoenzyme / L-aspartate aminotransferase apoenzyme [Candidatus Koribacter versatilis Ellin345]|uniref:Phosphoserine aminotransferase apoenzyme / L-aspartate aminotransferase apoenzyme n=1 Tax=Koribacter versatilis (strain Ellin345) TaxID=204669 RepID=Q1IVI1_KORVE|nr:alanine--glyoxylate aminotransferase family protein [Candidatus Koribacter versatilis]ABF39119.1 phosphoserine aminotransferase apoenzyme / L-aspartate aminotransferase apoenzyme [Candidatus Koribacter versatilis Ellin345]